jgi:hypothetical protein
MVVGVYCKLIKIEIIKLEERKIKTSTLQLGKSAIATPGFGFSGAWPA